VRPFGTIPSVRETVFSQAKIIFFWKFREMDLGDAVFMTGMKLPA